MSPDVFKPLSRACLIAVTLMLLPYALSAAPPWPPIEGAAPLLQAGPYAAALAGREAALRARLSGENRLECAMRRVPAAYDRTRLSEQLHGGVGPDWLHEMTLLDDGGEAEIWSGPGATLAASLIESDRSAVPVVFEIALLCRSS